MKKIIAMILALVMVLSMVPFAAFAAEELTLQMGQNTATLTGSEDGVTYTWTAEDSGTLTITMLKMPRTAGSILFPTAMLPVPLRPTTATVMMRKRIRWAMWFTARLWM